MLDIQKHIINHDESIRRAMEMINMIPESLTLFVVNDKQQLTGTLTDGDIRRGLLSGKSIDDSVASVMFTNYRAIISAIDPKEIREIRKAGVRLVPSLNDDKTIREIHDLSKLRSILPVDVVLMAGGKGERLKPLTEKTPKPMLPIGDKPIIEHNIDRIRSFGIKHITISINYLGDQIKNYLGDGSSRGIHINYIEETQFSGTIGSVSSLEKIDNPYVLVMNSDLFTDVDFEDLYLNLVENKADLAIATIPYTVNIPFAILSKKDGKVTGLKEKPSNTHYANAGIYLMKKSMMELIPSDTFFDATDLIEQAIEQGYKVIDNPLTGYWIDIGELEEYQKAQEIMKHLKNQP